MVSSGVEGCYNKTSRGDDVTTGEKLALLRRKMGMTQEELSEKLKVSRQSVSRWEMDAAFPETDKLIKLSRLFSCSIDFLLNDSIQENGSSDGELSAGECCWFIRECGYFFLATSVENRPSLRPFGMIYTDDTALFIATDRRKKVYSDLKENPQIEMASYNPVSHKWLRISGRVQEESSTPIRYAMMECYPRLKQTYRNEDEMHLVIYRILADTASIR